jgi:hypothetical protein
MRPELVEGLSAHADVARAIPVKINAPPTSCMGPGRCPSSTNAKITAKITSISETNEAPSCRAAGPRQCQSGTRAQH